MFKIIMKNILAIVLVLSSIIMFISKQYKIFILWKKITSIITDIKEIDNEQIISYKYKLYDLEYTGIFKDEIDNNRKIGDNIEIVYNKNNFELSLRKIPFQYEDYLMLLITVAGGLYLYFYSCENCECEMPSDTINSLVSEKVRSSTRNYE